MRHLLIDVGNTRVKHAVATDKRLGRISVFPTEQLSLKKIRDTRKESDVESVVICCVVADWGSRIQKSMSRVHLLSHRSELGFELRNYRKPETIGVDRLANAAGAVALFGCPVIAVDFGTAMTVDVVDGTGSFLGGVIAPGLLTFAEALAHKAPGLPEIRATGTAADAIGRSTTAAMTSGVYHGFTGMVREVMDAVQRHSGGQTVVTGGDAALMAKRLDCFDVVCKNLTFEGLRRIAALNC